MLIDIFPEVGELLAFGVGLMVLAVGVGATWVRYCSLQIADELEDNNGWYQVRVTNWGFTPVPVTVRLEEVADLNGPVREINAQLPLRMRWLNHGDQVELPLARGLSQKVILFSLNGYDRMSNRADNPVGVQSNGIEGRVNLGIVTAESHSALWLRFTFGSAGEYRWFAVRVTVTGYELMVTREDPPHLRR